MFRRGISGGTDRGGESDAAALVPDPHTAADTLAVTDGATTTIGFVIERDGSFFAYDKDAVLLGEFATRSQAVRSIPRVRT